MQWLAEVCVKRPVLATVLVLAICVIGFAGFANLGVDRFPNVDFPVVTVVTRLPGATPDQMETDVTDKIEEAVNTIGGIDEMRSTSTEGTSIVMVTFQLEKDVDVAAQEVRDKLARVQSDLPTGTEQPVISKVDPGATPVLYLALDADDDKRAVSELADKSVRRQLQTVPGVGQVTILGDTKRQVNIWVDPLALRARGITAAEVQHAVAGQNLTMPGGRVEAGPEQLGLRIKGRIESAAELASLVIAVRDGSPVRLGQVARVEDGAERAETLALRDGRPSVVLSIRKQSDANSVAVVDAVRERLALIQEGLPAGYRLEVVRDNTATIRTSVHAVEEHLLLGGLFAALVVLLFLGNLRSTIIAALAIPVSIIGTFALMWQQGFTLNTITLLALALAVGIVIDDAIVVLENIHRFVEEKGMSPREAAIAATREIGLAVLATTLSLLAVFVPVAFMSGIVGRFLKSFGLTMAFAIAVSLVVSFTLTPMLSARWLKKARPIGNGPHGRAHHKSLLERLVDKFYLPIERFYMRILRWAMSYRWIIALASVASLATVPFIAGRVKKGFLPDSDEAHFEINVRAAEGTSLEQTAITGERLARAVRQLPNVEATLLTIGDNEEKTPNLARVYVKLNDPGAREESQFQIMERVRQDIAARAIADDPALRIDVSQVAMFSGGGQSTAAVQLLLTGSDLGELDRYARLAVERVKHAPGAVDVSTTAPNPKPELSVSIERERAADLGVNVADVANTLRLLVGGAPISNYEENGQTYDVSLRAEERYRADAAGLALVSVPSTKLGSVPLSEVVKIGSATTPSQIERYNRRRQVMLLSNVAPGHASGQVLAAMEREVAALGMPSDYRALPVGQSKEMGKTMKAFGMAFLLAIVFMYLVLAAQFESWLHPITILVCLPLTLPFALVSLLIFDQALDIYSMLGLLVLFGVVKKNSILQIDHTNHLRSKGMERLAAILEGNRDRLKPILMTTLAFVAGMVPLLFSSGIGAGFNKATAGVIVGGQALSLLLTLLATPVVYSYFDDLGAWLARRFGRKDEAEPEQPAPIDGLPQPTP
jgi:hydrophobe/amphiphile efflux-1 (HAE1) family protein